MYEMKPEYYTGIAQIDEEHKKLFEIADEAYELYKNEFIPDKYDHIAKILNELRDYTKIHFQHEEEYMKSINYKGMFMQKVQHDQFCQKLDELDLEHLDENSEEVIQEVLTFLTDWLVHHILETDKKIAEIKTNCRIKRCKCHQGQKQAFMRQFLLCRIENEKSSQKPH